MAMTYAELKTNVQDITEMTFTDAQLGMFTKQAEQKIYDYAKGLPLLRKSKTYSNSSTLNGTILPTDCIYVHNVSIQTSERSGNYRYALLNKAIDFLDEAYPKTTEIASNSHRIEYYAVANNNNEGSTLYGSTLELRFAPHYSDSVTIIVDYHFRPRSITEDLDSNSEIWLGQNYDSALLNGVLFEAARFMKAEPDIQALYKEQYIMALTQLTDTVNTRMRSSSFRPQSPAAGPMPPAVPSEPK